MCLDWRRWAAVETDPSRLFYVQEKRFHCLVKKRDNDNKRRPPMLVYLYKGYIYRPLVGKE